MLESRTYDNTAGEPVVVLVVTGTDDVGRLVNTLLGACPVIEQLDIGHTIRRQVNRHNGGRQAIDLLRRRGGPDFSINPYAPHTAIVNYQDGAGTPGPGEYRLWHVPLNRAVCLHVTHAPECDLLGYGAECWFDRLWHNGIPASDIPLPGVYYAHHQGPEPYADGQFEAIRFWPRTEPAKSPRRAAE
jgi:hypothetical protein